MSISDEILKRVVESYRRIRNTLRFLLGNLADFDPRATRLPVDDGSRSTAGRSRARAMQEPRGGLRGATSSTSSTRRCRPSAPEDLARFYLDILKDRLYTTGADSHRAPLRADALLALIAESCCG